MAPSKKPKRVMTEAHKKAIADSRNQARTVEMYLLVLNDNSTGNKGRRLSQSDMKKELAIIDSKIRSRKISPLEMLKLTQKAMDLRASIAASESNNVVKELEKAFVKVGAAYSARHGIKAQAWRQVGVPASVLKAAGIK